ALAGERNVSAALPLRLDPAARAGLGAARRLAQRRELYELSIELPVRVGLLEPMALDLAAGRLRDALDRNDLRHLESGLLVDEPCDLLRGGEEIRNRAPVQHEDHQLLDFRLAGANPGGDYLAELEP